jgi:hypothetical protein
MITGSRGVMSALGMWRRYWIVAAAGLVWAGEAVAQDGPTPVDRETRAERTDYRETSSYDDVMAFVEAMARASSTIHLTGFGYSYEGRSLPLVVVGEVGGPGPDAVRHSGKVRVYVQGNIHAGEVCGKEALQILLRQVAQGRHAAWLDSVVLLIAPIYNADGNERVRLTNRPRQHGPVGGMGQRPNAQGLDLNRDHMKLESPEARSLARLFRDYDPDVALDLHTTNGTRRAYHLLYAPPLHPNTSPDIVQLLRDDWLPAVTEAVKAKHGWDYYYYGNLPWPGSQAERGWYTYDPRPRYNTNYVGLRNRIGILSEAYAYATFEERVLGTVWFVEEVVDYVYRRASAVRRAVRQADRHSVVGEALALRAAHERSRDSVEILLGEVIEERHPYTGRVMYRRTDAVYPERLPQFQTFRPTETERAPASYVVPPQLTAVLHLLDDHGITWNRLDEAVVRSVERFVIDSSTTAEREYQGHHQRTLYGRYETARVELSAGTAVVPVAQPLGRLAFALLEPRSDDGVLNWNVLDQALEGAVFYPILRLPLRGFGGP